MTWTLSQTLVHSCPDTGSDNGAYRGSDHGAASDSHHGRDIHADTQILRDTQISINIIYKVSGYEYEAISRITI